MINQVHVHSVLIIHLTVVIIHYSYLVIGTQAKKRELGSKSVYGTPGGFGNRPRTS